MAIWTVSAVLERGNRDGFGGLGRDSYPPLNSTPFPTS